MVPGRLWSSIKCPKPILAVPVPYYKKPPSHWKKHGPPPWAEAKGHGKKKGKGKDDQGRL
jgi:hypothetical protein